VLGHIDTRQTDHELSVSRGDDLPVDGWAVSTVPSLPLRKIVVLVDGEPRSEVDAFHVRTDVAEAFGRPDFSLSGWHSVIALNGLTPGTHVLTASAVLDDGRKIPVATVTLRLR
jgi:hypothetical protein